MASQFKTIGLMGRIRKPETKTTFDQMVELLTRLGLDFWVADDVARDLTLDSSRVMVKAEMVKKIDLGIVIGGDGSMLRAANAVVDAGVPLVGINRGRFGFLADISPGDAVDILPSILKGEYQQEDRLMLEVSFNDGERYSALNDIVLVSGDTAHMTEFEVYVDDAFMCSEHSDGMIVSTPTGSTAYALSGGGPIIHPASNAIVLVPMFSHTLNSRPVVLSAESRIRFKVGSRIDASPYVSCDGERVAKLEAGHEVLIRQKKKKVTLLHPRSYEYFKNLGRKLNWGRKLIAD